MGSRVPVQHYNLRSANSFIGSSLHDLNTVDARPGDIQGITADVVDRDAAVTDDSLDNDDDDSGAVVSVNSTYCSWFIVWWNWSLSFYFCSCAVSMFQLSAFWCWVLCAIGDIWISIFIVEFECQDIRNPVFEKKEIMCEKWVYSFESVCSSNVDFNFVLIIWCIWI